jgi:hypothetical protein
VIEKCIPLLKGSPNLNDYRRYLERNFGFYQPFESSLHTKMNQEGIMVDDLSEWNRDRRKVPIILSDFDRIGASTEGLEQCQVLPEVETRPQLLGCLYVMEGSTLGGKILARHLRETCPEYDACYPESTQSFLNPYGLKTDEMWARFRERLSKVTSAADLSALVESAKKTFDLMSLWLGARSS